jgi:hypothetical protein
MRKSLVLVAFLFSIISIPAFGQRRDGGSKGGSRSAQQYQQHQARPQAQTQAGTQARPQAQTQSRQQAQQARPQARPQQPIRPGQLTQPGQQANRIDRIDRSDRSNRSNRSDERSGNHDARGRSYDSRNFGREHSERFDREGGRMFNGRREYQYGGFWFYRSVWPDWFYNCDTYFAVASDGQWYAYCYSNPSLSIQVDIE